jgi:hypothetical protein
VCAKFCVVVTVYRMRTRAATASSMSTAFNASANHDMFGDFASATPQVRPGLWVQCVRRHALCALLCVVCESACAHSRCVPPVRVVWLQLVRRRAVRVHACVMCDVVAGSNSAHGSAIRTTSSSVAPAAGAGSSANALLSAASGDKSGACALMV